MMTGFDYEAVAKELRKCYPAPDLLDPPAMYLAALSVNALADALDTVEKANK